MNLNTRSCNRIKILVMANLSELIYNCDTIIKNSIESINLQKKLIEANMSGRFNLNRIIIHDAKEAIKQEQEAIQIFIDLKKRLINNQIK